MVKKGWTWTDEWCNYLIVVNINNEAIDALYSSSEDTIPSQGKILHFENELKFYKKLNEDKFKFKFECNVDGWMEYHRNKLVNSIKGNI